MRGKKKNLSIKMQILFDPTKLNSTKLSRIFPRKEFRNREIRFSFIRTRSSVFFFTVLYDFTS